MPSYKSKVAALSDKDSVCSMISQTCATAPTGTLPEANYLAIVDPVLNNTDFGFFVLCQDEADKAVGLLFFAYEWSDWRSGLFYWLQS